ncbi:protein of unknown function [Petrocella atlantisensis]|uniref:Uncharacterized protein n=1 Tax=Petrocella atlantisensis TaxID=2173034 RepID=A0A3P7RWN1_9FIRM|nr:hypothetical protein [Petrocella atlantisensis]VDN47166.1 protein of unknown function [Petrocella atlantisensis]
MIAEKLDAPLKEIMATFSELEFNNPKVLDAGELGVEANVEGTMIKVAIRRKNIYCELRGRRKSQHEWLFNHFRKLSCEDLLRKDYVFHPNCWKKENMTDDTNEVIRRIKLMIDLCRLNSINEITEEIGRLLELSDY